jgi:hypothetical protein
MIAFAFTTLQAQIELQRMRAAQEAGQAALVARSAVFDAHDGTVIDVEARVVDDTPALPAPAPTPP